MDKNKTNESPRKSNIIVSVAPYMNLSWTMLITIGLFILLGWWLDGQFDAKPVFIIIFAFLGIALALYNFIRTVNELGKKEKK